VWGELDTKSRSRRLYALWPAAAPGATCTAQHSVQQNTLTPAFPPRPLQVLLEPTTIYVKRIIALHEKVGAG